jgi:hypothetical protein
MSPRASLWIGLCCTGLCGHAARAQEDLRDRVVTVSGEVLTGRVSNPHDADEWLLMQGGKRVRVARANVAEADLVGERVREFCYRRMRHRGSVKAQQWLIDHAMSARLPGLARAQAIWLALVDEDNEKAHEFLEHKRTRKGWLWLHDGKYVARDKLDEALSKSPMTIVGERFTVQCDGDVAAGVAALLDLERLGVAWQRQFGAELGLREALAPARIVLHRDAEEFPKWGFRPRPYYAPEPQGDVGHTYYAGPARDRPALLFFVGTQALLYHTLIRDVRRPGERSRVCPWIEIGLGMLFEDTMQGDAGFAAPGQPSGRWQHARIALGRTRELTHLLQLPMYEGFFVTDDTETAQNWSACSMFVAWLLEPDNQPATRGPFLEYVREALGAGKGHSSSAFDRSMGRRVEALDRPFREWLTVMSRR